MADLHPPLTFVWRPYHLGKVEQARRPSTPQAFHISGFLYPWGEVPTNGTDAERAVVFWRRSLQFHEVRTIQSRLWLSMQRDGIIMNTSIAITVE